MDVERCLELSSYALPDKNIDSDLAQITDLIQRLVLRERKIQMVIRELRAFTSDGC